MNIHLILLLTYSVALAAMGLWVARYVRGAGDFFVAGRRLNAPLIFATFLASNIGAGTMVGATGVAYREGISAWWWNGAAGLGSLVLAFWVGPRIWRLASARGFYTAGDYLEYRYNSTVRGVVAALIWAGTLTILAAQLIAGAAVLNVVAGTSLTTGAVIGGVLMTLYFVAGGLLGSAWVNAVQLIVLIGGFLIAVPLLQTSIAATGGIGGIADAPEGYWNFLHSSGPRSGWTFVLLLTPAFIISPGLLQKAYGAASERVVRVGIGAQGLAQMAFAFLPVFFGIAARAAGLEITREDLVLPTVLATQLPPWVGALGLAAVFSAEVSTCDAILFMLSTSLSKDLYKRFINPAAADKQVLLVARLAAVLGGFAGVVLAIQLGSIIAALTIFYSLLGVSLFVPVVGGLFTARAGVASAFGSIVAGVTTLLAVHVTTAGQGFGFLTPNLLGLVAAGAAYYVLIPRTGGGGVGGRGEGSSRAGPLPASGCLLPAPRCPLRAWPEPARGAVPHEGSRSLGAVLQRSPAGLQREAPAAHFLRGCSQREASGQREAGIGSTQVAEPCRRQARRITAAVDSGVARNQLDRPGLATSLRVRCSSCPLLLPLPAFRGPLPATTYAAFQVSAFGSRFPLTTACFLLLSSRCRLPAASAPLWRRRLLSAE
ncbi:MAG: sodium:solute symporter family protein [Acidobacteria bacterium]|nr:sodium:solute symporter family protein [Acidobacteriota bacterium]